MLDVQTKCDLLVRNCKCLICEFHK
jgi:hypothetical protein